MSRLNMAHVQRRDYRKLISELGLNEYMHQHVFMYVRVKMSEVGLILLIYQRRDYRKLISEVG